MHAHHVLDHMVGLLDSEPGLATQRSNILSCEMAALGELRQAFCQA